MKAIQIYIINLVLLLVIDGVWLGVVAKSFYKNQIGHLMREGVVWPAVAAFYIIYALVITILVSQPALQKGSWIQALASGALLGLAAYGAYDFTNLATLKNWPILVTMVDLLWGIFITATVSALSFWTTQYFAK